MSHHACPLFRLAFSTLCVLILHLAAFAPLQAAQKADRRVVFLPFTVEVPDTPEHVQTGLANVLASRVATRSRITAITEGKTTDQIREALKNRDFAAVDRLLADTKADYLILGTFGPSSARYELASYVFSKNGGAPKKVSRFLSNAKDPLASVEDLAADVSSVIEGKSVTSAGSGTSSAFTSANPERAWRQNRLAESVAGLEQAADGDFELVESLRGRPIDMEALDCNIGDVDGDGTPELILLTATSLEFYHYNDGSFVKRFSQDLPKHLRYLAVTLADANKNGVPEIYLGASNGLLAASSIWEWHDGKLEKLEDNVPYYLHAVALPEGGAMLLGQTPPPGRAAGGKIALMRYEGDKLRPSDNVLPLPETCNIYDVAPVDLDGDGNLEIVALNQKNRLQVFKGGEVVWTSTDEYAASRNYYGTTLEAAQSSEEPVYLHTRIVLADLDRDGTPEVVVGKNREKTAPFLPGIRYFDGSSLAGLKWEDGMMRTVWETRQIAGYIAGYQLILEPGETRRFQLFFAETTSPSVFQFWTSPQTSLNRFVLAPR